jgi:hypothetical protein
MKQCDAACPHFKFIGVVPIDFSAPDPYDKTSKKCMNPEFCLVDLKAERAAGKTVLGAVFNLDPHYKDGSHWVSLFINLKKRQIFYFDSTGDPIPPQIQKFVDKIMEQGNMLNPKLICNFDQNHPVEHQYGNTECGVYSIFFIVHMLEDKITSHYLKTHILKDEYMQKFRKIFFNDEL